MTEYRPNSRRPIADAFRRTADLAVRFCVKSGISPDAVSYSSIVAAAVAGAMFWQSSRYPILLLIAPLFCFARLWLNMLDGMVAIAAKTASKRGEIVNEVPDRISDVLIFAGVAHSTFCNPIILYWAAILAIMTAYIGVTGQAVAGRREYGGLMSKPWRMVWLAVGAWITWALLPDNLNRFSFGNLRPFDWISVLIIVGCLQTCIVRLRRTLSLLDQR
jgi:phosphatidylglycerophosphate synthase